MPTVTVQVSSEVKHEMDQAQFVNWSAVAREAIEEKLMHLRVLNKIAAKSKFSEKDVEDLGRKIKQSMWKKYQEKGW